MSSAAAGFLEAREKRSTIQARAAGAPFASWTTSCGERGNRMDPITLILAALAAGAASGLKDTAGEAIRDTYGALKGLVQRKLGGDAAKELVLEEHEKDPEVWKEPLKKALTD